jgi:hypothetical protein
VSFLPATHDPARRDGRRPDTVPRAYTRMGDDVNVMRLESILVIAILLALLLQLPRLGDAQPPTLVGGEILRIGDLEGAAVYVDIGMGGVSLVHVSRLGLHRDSAGNAYVTRLEGTFLEAGSEYSGVRIDTTQRAEELGWRPAISLDGLLFPGPNGTREAYEFRRLRFQKLLHNGLILLAVGSIEGVNRTTGRAISERYAPGRAVCPTLPVIQCTSVSGASGDCRVHERGGWIVGCRCSNGGECSWTVTGTACWQGGCEGTCRRGTGWSAECRCGEPVT